MRELSGLSYAEIASALSVSEGAARQTVYEAREAMREAQLGRDVDCLDIRRIISERDGRKLRGRQTRAHLRACEGCRDFQLAIKQRQGDLQLIAPPMSAAAATALLGAGGVLGGGAGGLAGAGGAATGASLLGKAAAVIAIAAAGTGVAGVTGAIDVPGLGASNEHSEAAAPAGAQDDPAATPEWKAAGGPSERDSSQPGRGDGASSRPAGNPEPQQQGAGSGRGASESDPPAHAGAGSSGQGVPAGGSDGVTGPPEHANGNGPPATAGTGQGNAGGNSATSQGASAAPPRSDSGTAHSNAGNGGPPEHANGNGTRTSSGLAVQGPHRSAASARSNT